jgi:hypothetical protein
LTSYAFWLQTNYTGSVTDVGYGVNLSVANHGVWIDNPKAQWSGYDVAFGDVPIWDLKAAGQMKLVGSYLSQCTLNVPAGGSLVASQSRLASMPYVSQAGTVNFSTNCLSSGNSFIAANLADVPYVANGITAATNNLIPAWTDGSPWGGPPNNPVSANLGWQLASGSNYSFDVTSPYFSSNSRPNVTITVSTAGVPTNGSLTVSYDSSSGMKSGPFNSRSFSVTDARFAAPNGVDIQLTASNCNPLVYYVVVYATNNLGVAPQQQLSGGQARVLTTVAPPAVNFAAPGISADGRMILRGNGGAANGSYRVLMATNLEMPVSEWTVVSTNYFNGDGSFSNTVPVEPGIPQTYYRLQMP